MHKFLLLLCCFSLFSTSLHAAGTASSIIDSSYDPENADIALTANGKIVIVFESDNVSVDKEIYYMESTNNGATWSTPVIVSDASDGFVAELPRIATYSNEVHVVWEEENGGAQEILYRRSPDGVWSSASAEVVVSDGDAIHSMNPDIAIGRGVANGNIYITWQDLQDGNFEIYGNNFASDANLAAIPASARFSDQDGVSSTNPAITIDPSDSNNFYVAWADSQDGQPEVYFRSTSGAIVTDTRASSDDSSNSQLPAIAASTIHLQFAWEDYRYFGLNETDIFTRNYTVDGIAGDKNELVKNNAASKAPTLTTTQDGSFHMAWQDDRGSAYEIYYAKKDAIGWSSPLALTTSSADSERPVAIASPYSGDTSTGVYIVWQENSSLYFIYLGSGGASGDSPTAVTDPAADETDVSATVQPSATYSKALDPTTVSDTTVKLFLEATVETQVSGTVSLGSQNTKVVFHPSSPLSYGSNYRFELSPTIADTEGNNAVGYIIRFTTLSKGTVIGTGVKISDVAVLRVGTSVAFQYNLNYSEGNPVNSAMIKIYNTGGRLVKKIEDPDSLGDVVVTTWDGVTKHGDRVSNGVYIFTITAKVPGATDTFKGRFLIAD